MSVRRSTALTAALLCLVVFTLAWLGMRAFVSTRLTGNAVNATRTELAGMADAYRAAALGGGRAALASSTGSGDAMFEVVSDTGEVVVRSSNLNDLDPGRIPLPPAPAGAPPGWTTTASATLRSTVHPQWREYRTYTVLGNVVDNVAADLVEPFGRQGYTMDAGLAGASRDAAKHYRLTLYRFVLPWDTLRAVTAFDEMLQVFIPLAVVVTALVAWFAAGRALRPVEAIRRELAEVTVHQYDRRVPVPLTRDEIARLARTTNTTLDRLQRAHDQQERFVADASHELRSPLANVRAGLEVALAHPDRADWPSVARRSLVDVQRLQRITADLLQLAVDPAEAPRPSEVVDLADVVREQVAERALVLDGPAIRSVVDGPGPVSGDPLQLERLLRNLLDNAVRHAATSVTVHIGWSAGDVVLEVLDDGRGIPAEERERVFDRFTRLDDARTRDAGGSGLGLTLARDIAARHGGTLRVEDSETGARLVARLPAHR